MRVDDDASTNADQSQGETPADLRYSRHQHDNVTVDRELDGTGHLARGDHTRMSTLKFSSRHPARDTRDPEFTFRPAPDASDVRPAEATPTATVSASPSLVERIKDLFR